MRKKPVQARSRETVNIIYEAAARILERDGRLGFTTSAVAERAGISIGTLYHYFESADAILIAMAREEIAAHAAAMVRAVSAPVRRGDVRAIVRALLAASDHRLQARRIASETLIAYGLGAELAVPLDAVAATLEASERLAAPEGMRRLSKAGWFVLTRAVSGVINSALRERSPLVGSQDLEDELVQLIEGHRASPGGAAG